MAAQSSDDQPTPEAVATGIEDAAAAEADRFFSLLHQKTEDLALNQA